MIGCTAREVKRGFPEIAAGQISDPLIITHILRIVETRIIRIPVPRVVWRWRWPKPARNPPRCAWTRRWPGSRPRPEWDEPDQAAADIAAVVRGREAMLTAHQILGTL
jgi:hypothetical protein